MTSPAQLRRLKANAEARAERLRTELATALKEIALFGELLALHSADDRSNIGSNMQGQTEATTRRARISAGRSTIKSESRDAAASADLTDGDIAKIAGASRQAVQKWHTGKLAIPKRHAEKLVKRGIPLEAWPRVSD